VPDPPPVQFVLPGDYALVDHLERPFTPETLRGKVWVAGFVFTTCPSSCPVVTQAMADLRERFDRYDVDVEMVSFTVDPAHDTPQVLREYFEGIGVESDKWRFVTGDPKAVISLVSEGFKLGVGDREADAEGVAYDIAHSTRLALVDGEGGVRGTYPIDGEHGTDEIFERAEHILRELSSRPSGAEGRQR
jgi:protein SCO1/2